jgi:gamma-glutamylcyclotransferase (GGCT)/AIG2-like uncharacterized protein YtfP
VADDRLRYFAYGSNMSLDVLAHESEDGRFLGAARLADYRLAFTRDSKTWRAGAADIVAASGMCVWGALYELSSDFVANTLDTKEGAGLAYARVDVEVEHGVDRCTALTYEVIDKQRPELRPDDAYLQRLIDGAKACGLPENYRSFLRSLQDEHSDAFREGFSVLPTTTRRHSEGTGLLRVAPEVAERLNLSRLAAVRRGKSVCIAGVRRVDGLSSDACEIDQNVRHALGIVGYETYGATVTLHPVVAPRFRLFRPLVRPRVLFLKLQMPRWMDSEKSICVLHENNIRLLGLSEGDYVDVVYAAEGERGQTPDYRIGSASFRVFSGSADEQPRGDETIPYPQIDELYLDADGRARIGVPARVVGVPVIVSADVGRLFSGRLLFYGATVLLSGTALWPLVEVATRRLGWSATVALVLTVVLSLGLTAVFTVFDIRGRVRY